jgi:hypothetical protein
MEVVDLVSSSSSSSGSDDDGDGGGGRTTIGTHPAPPTPPQLTAGAELHRSGSIQRQFWLHQDGAGGMPQGGVNAATQMEVEGALGVGNTLGRDPILPPPTPARHSPLCGVHLPAKRKARTKLDALQGFAAGASHKRLKQSAAATPGSAIRDGCRGQRGHAPLLPKPAVARPSALGPHAAGVKQLRTHSAIDVHKFPLGTQHASQPMACSTPRKMSGPLPASQNIHSTSVHPWRGHQQGTGQELPAAKGALGSRGVARVQQPAQALRGCAGMHARCQT